MALKLRFSFGPIIYIIGLLMTLPALGYGSSVYILTYTAQDTASVSSVSDTTIVKDPATLPVYPGSNENLAKDLQRGIEFPSQARNEGIAKARVIVSFVIEKDGSISDVTVLREAGHGFDETAIKAVKKLKKFEEPARDEAGNPVRTSFVLPILFVEQ